jgi:hypothetical protein
MESTGRPGWIHASEQTAAELRAQGQHHWLHAREDQVLAKGLGELSTYWIILPKGNRRWGSLSTTTMMMTTNTNRVVTSWSLKWKM